MSDGPLIVQSDKTLLLDIENPGDADHKHQNVVERLQHLLSLKNHQNTSIPIDLLHWDYGMPEHQDMMLNK